MITKKKLINKNNCILFKKTPRLAVSDHMSYENICGQLFENSIKIIKNVPIL